MSVSVLLATFNSEKYLAQLINSILSQTYEDFTLFVRDDCSSDGTMAIVNSYSDKRLIILPNETPSGSAQNNFYALLSARIDDYIMFADADDVWLPDKIERTLACMRTQEKKYGETCPILVHSDLKVVDKNLDMIAGSMFRYEKLSPRRTELGQLLVQNNVTGCTVMINHALHSFVPKKPESSVMHDWWLALVASAFGKVAVVDEPTILYRQHGSNQVGAYDASNLKAAAKKLGRRRRMREIYALMYSQADCFADTFAELLSESQLETCRAYGAMKNKNKFGKIATIIRYKFYKNTLLRNIGQVVII